MLLGANQTDSPYLLPDPEAYFAQLTSHGGNYCRYVVKQRLDPGLLQIFPFKKLTDGRYDLNAWNDEYWDRFEEGLKTTRDLNIVVQMELWDRFPFAWQPPALGVPDIWVNHVIDHPELYSFCAFQFQTIIVGGQGHYDRLAEVHEWVQAAQSGPRPVNAVKIFAHTELLPTDVGLENEPNAQTRYWRPLMAGWAALSLHREPDEAYLLAHPGKAYGIYFPTTGSVQIDLGGPSVPRLPFNGSTLKRVLFTGSRNPSDRVRSSRCEPPIPEATRDGLQRWSSIRISGENHRLPLDFATLLRLEVFLLSEMGAGLSISSERSPSRISRSTVMTVPWRAPRGIESADSNGSNRVKSFVRKAPY